MKILIVYGSVYGNTEMIAKAIAGAAATSGEVKILRAGEAGPSDLAAVDILVVGSPTQGGRPTQAVLEFLGKIPEPAVRSVKVAAFDTRLTAKWVKIFGYAAPRIASALKGKSGIQIASPEGFFVRGTKGPLKEGEPERAAGWAERILK
jgi:flavodoxin